MTTTQTATPVLTLDSMQSLRTNWFTDQYGATWVQDRPGYSPQAKKYACSICDRTVRGAYFGGSNDEFRCSRHITVLNETTR